MAGVDRYFGGRAGAAEKARKRAHARHGASRGQRVYLEDLARRRREYAARGRGTGLQRAVRDAK